MTQRRRDLAYKHCLSGTILWTCFCCFSCAGLPRVTPAVVVLTSTTARRPLIGHATGSSASHLHRCSQRALQSPSKLCCSCHAWFLCFAGRSTCFSSSPFFSGISRLGCATVYWSLGPCPRPLRIFYLHFFCTSRYRFGAMPSALCLAGFLGTVIRLRNLRLGCETQALPVWSHAFCSRVRIIPTVLEPCLLLSVWQVSLARSFASGT